MTEFLKMLLLADSFDDEASKWMVFWEWYRKDPVLSLRWEVAIRSGDMVG